MGSMTTPVTPLRSPALADLQNAMQIADVYAGKDIADSDAKQALGRVRKLVAQALASLGEPNGAAVQAARPFTGRNDMSDVVGDYRRARDAAAVILHAALTGEVAGESWVHSLPCPDCDGAAIIKGFPCEGCKGTGIST